MMCFANCRPAGFFLFSQSSADKTSMACQRRIRYMLKNKNTLNSVNAYVGEALTDPVSLLFLSSKATRTDPLLVTNAFFFTNQGKNMLWSFQKIFNTFKKGKQYSKSSWDINRRPVFLKLVEALREKFRWEMFTNF